MLFQFFDSVGEPFKFIGHVITHRTRAVKLRSQLTVEERILFGLLDVTLIIGLIFFVFFEYLTLGLLILK